MTSRLRRLIAAAAIAAAAALATTAQANAAEVDQITRLPDGAAAHASDATTTGALPTTSTRRASDPAARALARADSDNPPITFDEVPVGSTITDDYADQGVIFTSDVFTSSDDANLTAPVLSGVPKFWGDITADFVTAGTATPTTVNGFALDVGYIDSRSSVVVDYLDSRGFVVGSQYAQSYGINHLTITFRGIAGFTVRTVSDEPKGFAIDNLTIDPTVTAAVSTMASMGDSYSSGEGRTDGRYDCATDLWKGTYLQDTTVPDYGQFWIDGDCDTRTMSYQEPSDLFSRPLVPYDNRCHRNGQAYPNLLAQALRAQQFIFVACSGAITDNIGATDGGSHVSPAAQHPQSPANVAGAHTQLTDVLDFRAQRLGDRDPDVMTVGIGGNDGQFSELVQHCARPWVSDCEDGTYWADGAVSQIDGDVFNRLVDTYTTLRDRFPGSTLLVFGYPTVIEPGASCGVSTAGLDGNETRFLGGTILTTLNQAVADAAAQAGAYYVDISRVTQGHDVCSDDPWINGLRLGLDGVEAESFHPNVTAHQRIAQYVVDHYTDGQGNLLVANPEPSEPIRPAVGHSMHLATLRGYVQQSCGAQCIQPAACVLTCQLQVQGDGYAPGSQLNMVLHSTPAELGSVMADAQGRIDTVVTIPPGTEAGLHWLAVDGSAPDGTDQEGTLGVNVFATAPPPTRVRPAVAAPVPVPPAAAATPSASRPIAPPKRKKVGVKVRVTRRGTTARIRLTCPRSAPSSCKVAALLKIKRPTKRHRTHLVTLVTKRVTIKPGRTVTLVLRRATIQRARRRLRLTVTTTTSVGTLRTTFRIPR